MGFEPKKCMVTFNSKIENPPAGGKQIGSKVAACYSREAAIYEEDDEGEPEVSSTPRNVVNDIVNFGWAS
jgi:hypothetical protein